jgi:hypothetical protein
MSKPRMGTMTDRGSGRWRLQVAVDPDPVSGERRRLSRIIRGTGSEAKDALQRLAVDVGACGDLGACAVLQAHEMAAATVGVAGL